MDFQSSAEKLSINHLLKPKSYAVKTYRMELGADALDQYQMISNEINFLRELRICENIVQLERCYVGFDEKSGCKTISLVMVLAKYGSILKHL